MQTRIGITASVLGVDFRAAPTAARQLGFDGLLVDVVSPSLDLTEVSESGKREIRHLFSSQGREFIGLQLDLGRNGLRPGADVDNALDRVDQAMQSAPALGARCVCVDLGPLPEPAVVVPPRPRVSPAEAGLILLPDPKAAEPEPVPDSKPPDPSFVSQVDAALFELGRRADGYGVMVALRSTLASFAAVDRAFQAARCPWFGLDFDPAALLGDRWDAYELLSQFGASLNHVRGRDAVKGTDHRVRPVVLGSGDVGWESLIADLESAAYRGWITLDPAELTDRLGAAVAGMKMLRTLRSE